MMSIIRSLKNIKLSVFVLFVILYFYFMINNFFTDVLSPIAVLAVLIIVIMGGLQIVVNKGVLYSKFLISLSFWMFWCLLMSLLYFTSFGQLSSSILWVCALFCSFSFVKNDGDVNLIVFGGVCVCIYALYLGVITMDIGNYIKLTVSSDFDQNENVAIFPLITVPLIMLIDKKIIKWGLLLLILIVILLTARRTAALCIIFIFIVNIVQEFKKNRNTSKSKRYIYTIVIVGVVIYTIYNMLTGTFAELFENLLLRFNSIGNDEGSGRMPIYRSVWNGFLQGNLGEYLIGHGYLGVDRVIHHTAAHNDFLEYLFDYGIIGAFFYVSLHIYFLKRIMFLYEIKSFFLYSYIVSYCIFFLYGMLGNIIIYPQYFLLLPIYWGIIEKYIMYNIKKT